MSQVAQDWILGERMTKAIRTINTIFEHERTVNCPAHLRLMIEACNAMPLRTVREIAAWEGAWIRVITRLRIGS